MAVNMIMIQQQQQQVTFLESERCSDSQIPPPTPMESETS